MDTGFETIGNATLICYDGGPFLATDPWIQGAAYHGSWGLSHEVPEQQLAAVRACKYVWLSHGHPDHLSVPSLESIHDPTILLADHVGGRLAKDLTGLGYRVTVLPDRKWTPLSDRVKVMSIADYNQDSVLLVDLGGTLVVNLNDAAPCGWGMTVKRTVRSYPYSILLKLFGYGDVDMMNYFDESGRRIEPTAAEKRPVGASVARIAESFGVNAVVPFSSFHQYQRADSVWANAYSTPLEAYPVGFESTLVELQPAFVRFDARTRRFEPINPAKAAPTSIDPSEFGDDWDERLDEQDVSDLKAYFQSIEHLERKIDFITFRVGGEDHTVTLRGGTSDPKGIVFEAPRASLMNSVRVEVFDDMLIGNFMKTTLIGEWPKSRLYPDFTPYVSKYADNGRAKTEREVKAYFAKYRSRAPFDYLHDRWQDALVATARSRLSGHGKLYAIGTAVRWKLFKWV